MTQMAANAAFDVFLCHNSKDKPEVKKIGEELKKRGMKPWLDEWELQPGRPWQRALEAQIASISSAAVFVGKDGVGPWQQMELEAYLREFVRRGRSVIPVLLKDAPEKPQVPLFLQGMTWVDFSKQEPDPMKQLIWGITSKKSGTDGSKDVPGEVPIPEPPIAPIGLTSGQRRRLERKHDELQRSWDLRDEKIQGIQEALDIETDPSLKFKYQKQLLQEKAALTQLREELDQIEQELQ